VQTVNVLKEILGWSADRPSWHRDCLRRLLAQGELKQSDVDELVAHCKTTHGLAKTAGIEPLEAKHLPEPAATTKPIHLTSLTHRQGVNALGIDQTINFGPNLTVVYGANAAGKSGYTRILKRACRARGAEEILGNVVSGSAPGRPSATIRYSLDGVAKDFAWDDDKPADKHLSRVSVFDRHCASVYIAEETDVAFRPLGLDLFDKLAAACELVRRALEKERRELEDTALQLPTVPEGTSVHELLLHLTSLTKPEDVTRLATLTEQETANIEEMRARLRELQSDDPQKAARALELRAKRFETVASKIDQVFEMLSEQNLVAVFKARDRGIQASKAVEDMRRVAFGEQPLPNTGSDHWRLLWSAAERYSTEDAYPEETFPVIGTNSRCVLCQQRLQDEGIRRLQRFQEFVSSEGQRERDEAVNQFSRLRARLSDLVVTDGGLREVLDELQLEEASLSDSARNFLESADHLRVAVLNGLAETKPLSDLTSIASAPSLLPHAGKLRARASELRGSGRSEATKQIEVALQALEARQILAKHLNAVLSEIERKKRLAAYQLCLEETKTTAITRKSSEITKLAVTEQLAKSFKEELVALKFRHVEVEMAASGGSRGALYHKLQLRRAPGVSVPKVVSEGEARCLSIASFFAELSTSSDRSAILFDDPVSSLDHEWRGKVAARLVAEAKSRQVVVFTHDIVFLLALSEEAESADVDVKPQYLRRDGISAGITAERLPWPAMDVKKRVGHLKDLRQDAEKLHRDGKQAEYERAGAHAYGLLREAWERAVEEVLLNGVVERYRNSIQTQRAKCLGDVCDVDCKALDEGMKKCSKWITGHDHAAAENTPFPDPAELEADIKALEDWVATIRKRR